MKIGVIHGPNLGQLGIREPEVYGHTTLADVNGKMAALAGELGVELETVHSNHEGDLLDFIHEMRPGVEGFVVNAGAFTHTSVALRDGLVGSGRPFVEVHLTNTAAREDFRHHSFLAGAAVGVVAGFGPDSYLLGLQGLVSLLREH